MTGAPGEAPASLEKRAAALEMVLRRKADMPENFVGGFIENADNAWIAANPPPAITGGWSQHEYAYAVDNEEHFWRSRPNNMAGEIDGRR